VEILFDKHRFYAGPDPQDPLAEITFQQQDDHTIVVDHTFTDPSLRGQGIARQLVDRVAAYAREEGLKVRATCSYARKVLSEDQFSDLYIS